MLAPDKWFDREFDLGLQDQMFPLVMARLRGTPARLEDMLRGVSNVRMLYREGTTWSVQEHVGHILDSEELWLGRVEDFVNRRSELRPADLQNNKTYHANHHLHDMNQILREFRRARIWLVQALENCDHDLLKHTALHPRLNKQMRLVDHAFFVAEHDDHHLAVIHSLLHR
ncbi:DinB family protein [bacterium]|nr:DinB family protein [bacterium]